MKMWRIFKHSKISSTALPTILVIVTLILQLTLVVEVKGDEDDDDIKSKGDYGDAELNELKHMPRQNITPYLLSKAGFPLETHKTLTEDGYYLTMHRIPYGNRPDSVDSATANTTIGNGTFPGNSSTSTGVKRKPAVLILHGFLACDECWLINPPSRSLPYILANRNYDVWLGNLRGCFYSKNHTKLPINSGAFWDFGFHEQGMYDLPAMIDYILNATGHKKINLIGHSMGTTVIFVTLSMRPEYNDKVNMSINLAPVAHLTHVTSPTVRVSAYLLHVMRNTGFLNDALGKLHLPFWPRNDYTEDQIQKHICKNERRKKWCMASFFLFMGFDYCQMSIDNFDLFTSIYPAGTSSQLGLHFEQLVYSKKFQQYDFGPEQNLERYGSVTPPSYNLSRIRSPMTLFFADNDWLANPRDVETLVKELSPSTVQSCRVKFHRFNHLDFLVAKDVNVLLYDRILNVLDGQPCRVGDVDSDAFDEKVSCNFPVDHDFMIPDRHRDQFNKISSALKNWVQKSQFLPSNR